MEMNPLEERIRSFFKPTGEEERFPFATYLIILGLAFLVLFSVLLGSKLTVTSPKGCEIAAWARNIASGSGFSSGAHWLGEIFQSQGGDIAAVHYPPFPALVHSLPIEIFGENPFSVLAVSMVLYMGLPLWVLSTGRSLGVSVWTRVLTASILVFFPPLMNAAFQPDGEIILAFLGALTLGALFQARERVDYLWTGLLAGTALTVSPDAIALPVCVGVTLWFSTREEGADGVGPRLLSFLGGMVPGILALGAFLILSSPEPHSLGELWNRFMLLDSDRGLGVQRTPVAPSLWNPPDLPGGTLGIVLDGLARHSTGALGTAPIWCWGVLAIGLLTGSDPLRRRIAVSLVGWVAVWLVRAVRFGEQTDAFTLFTVWLLLLAVETVVRILETLARYNRINPPFKTAAVGTLILVTWWPGFYQIRSLRTLMSPERVRLENLWAQRIEGITDPDALLVTDTPEQLAWKTNRRTVWLPAAPSLLKKFNSLDTDCEIVLSGSIQSARDVDPSWWDLFEAGSGVGDFNRVYLDRETYCQVWKRSETENLPTSR